MVFVEMMSPHGHIRLNNFYLENIFSSGDVLMVDRELSVNYSRFNCLLIPKFKNGIFNRLRLGITVLRELPKIGEKKICFLSYDLLVMPIIAFLLRMLGWRVAVFEHNTAPSSALKKIFQVLVGKSVLHIAYASYISSKFLDLRLNAITVPHPLLSARMEESADAEFLNFVMEKTRSYTSMVLVPSGSTDIQRIEELARLHKDKLFVVKRKNEALGQNILTRSHFSAYIDLMKMADFVCIPFLPMDKVSGPFFEAIALGKTVILNRGVFGEYAKENFPKSVLFEDEFWAAPDFDGRVDCQKHNFDLLSILKNVLN